MNKFMTIIIALLISTAAFAGDSFDKVYSKYASSNEVTSINITKSMIKLASNFLDKEDVESRKLLESIESVKVLISEGGSQQFSSDAKTISDNKDYEELMRIADSGDKVLLLVKEQGENIQEVVVLVDSESEFIVANIKGNIDLDQVGKALKSLNIDVNGLN